MKKIRIILTIVISIIIIGVMFNMIFTFTVHPSVIFVKNVNVTNNIIAMEGEFAASAIWFKGYRAEYHNNILYIKIKGSSISFPNLSGSINISIPNKYGTINKIYLQDNVPSGNIIIWPKDKNPFAKQ